MATDLQVGQALCRFETAWQEIGQIRAPNCATTLTLAFFAQQVTVAAPPAIATHDARRRWFPRFRETIVECFRFRHDDCF